VHIENIPKQSFLGRTESRVTSSRGAYSEGAILSQIDIATLEGKPAGDGNREMI
jgi:hypothetical protein